MPHPLKIILIDDHLLFRVGIRTALENSGTDIELVGEAGSAADLFEILSTKSADIILLDIVLPDFSGIEIARRLRKEYPELKILMLSAESSNEIITKLLEIGVNGFISKAVGIDELLRAIDYVSEGADYFGKDIAKLIHSVRIAREKNPKIKIDFTERENEIIELCAKGLLAKEIAKQLNINVCTVNTHKNNIFKKLGINNSVELVRYAMQHNIIKL